MLNTVLFISILVVSIGLLSPVTAPALDCPTAPAQVGTDWESEVDATVAKIGFVKGGELRTKTKKATQDLLSKLPDSNKVYLEQMMFSAYCSALRDDKTMQESEKAKLLKEYNAEVRKTIAGQRSTAPQAASKESSRIELTKMSLAFTPEAFIESAKKGDLTAVKLFLAAGMAPDALPDEYGMPTLKGDTALFYAAGAGHTEMMKALIKAKADVNKTNREGYTALSWAASNGKKDAMLLLLKNGSNREAINKALVAAAASGEVDTISFLLERGADVKTAGPEALLETVRSTTYGVKEEHRRQKIDLLLSRGVDVNARNGEGWTPLLFAVDGKHVPAIRTLLEKGANVNAKCDCTGYLAGGWTGLMIAVSNRDHESATLLLAKGADVNLRNNKGQSALMLAVEKDDPDTVRALLDRGANVKARDNNGVSVLMVAARKGDERSITALLEKGADVNEKDNDGWTPLMFASYDGRTECARLLLDRKAEVHQKSVKGMTPLMIAAKYGYGDVARLLLERGAPVNDRDALDKTALAFAEEKLTGDAKTEMVLLLKKAGAQ